jgi:hypothetical protein
MDKIIDKIDKYNLFTNIVPGYLLLMFNIYYLKIENLNIGEQIIISYFIGQTLSRLGSIIGQKILFKFTKEKGESYDKYIIASDKDTKIATLMQERNMCRTFCVLFVICIIEIILTKIININSVKSDIILIILLFILLVIYAISFCKYNKYVLDRIKIQNKR